MSEAALLVTGVGAATGARAAAAALACAGSGPDRAGLLIDLGNSRPARPSLIATNAARSLEERLASHLPEAEVASRGQICRLSLPRERDGLEPIAGLLAIVRDSLGVIHLPARLLQAALAESGLRPAGTLLRAELAEDRALTALVVADLIDRGVAVSVLKRPLGWAAARRAMAGLLPRGGAGGLPPRICDRMLSRAGAAQDADPVICGHGGLVQDADPVI